MFGDDYEMSQRVIAESNNTLVVKALEESIEELRGEIDFLKEENKRLRNVSRATRTSTRKARNTAKSLLEQVEEMGQHIMDIAAEESGNGDALVDREPPLSEYPNIKMFEGVDGTMVPLQKRESDSTPAAAQTT